MSLREALTYLDGLGFDHLYPPAASMPVSAAPPREEARPPLPSVTDAASLAPEQRAQVLDAARASALGCRACRLCDGRISVVFGSGAPGARLMLVGEGPGAEEDRQGLPFVGAAGELLTKILGAIGLARDEVYIANVVKCRPPDNRDPRPDEVAACRAYLEQQIDLVRPAVLVALGRVAGQSLLGSSQSLGALRGTWHEVRGVAARVTYHPAALLRDPSYKRPTWEDMQIVRDRLAQMRPPARA